MPARPDTAGADEPPPELPEPPLFPELLFPELRRRFSLTRDLVLELRDSEELLDREPVLQRSIRLRNPYVDPMSLVQVDLLRRWRAGGREDDELERALDLAVERLLGLHILEDRLNDDVGPGHARALDVGHPVDGEQFGVVAMRHRRTVAASECGIRTHC